MLVIKADLPVIRFHVCKDLSAPTVRASLPLGWTDTLFIADLSIYKTTLYTVIKNRESYISAHVLLTLLNKLRKR